MGSVNCSYLLVVGLVVIVVGRVMVNSIGNGSGGRSDKFSWYILNDIHERNLITKIVNSKKTNFPLHPPTDFDGMYRQEDRRLVLQTKIL